MTRGSQSTIPQETSRHSDAAIEKRVTHCARVPRLPLGMLNPGCPTRKALRASYKLAPLLHVFVEQSPTAVVAS
jgi:hypothetical protein